MNARFFVCLLLLLSFLPLSTATHNGSSDSGKLQVYIFHSETCAHCKALLAFMPEMEAKYPSIEVHRLSVSEILPEVAENPNVALLFHMARGRGVEVSGVPVTFIGEKSVLTGFELDGSDKQVLDDMIAAELSGLGGSVTKTKSLSIPFFGKLDPTSVSLPVLTLVMGLLDGFNPCAMYILLFLLALLAQTRSRKKMFLIGGTFIFISGAVYFTFMAAWLNAYFILGYLGIFTKLAAIIAIIAGFFNVKDYFFFGKWFSFKVPEAHRDTVFTKMRAIVNHNSIVISLAGASVLAVSVNFIELICTFGFPAIYTRVLSMQNYPAWLYYTYLFFYNVLYMLDDLLVFTIALWALSTMRLTEKQGKWLKLVSGIIMLWLGLVLLLQPGLLVFG
ncbi:hypothetical protein HY992_04700 [Candidatus Micrarchaeota archaeon]|nr:hypothetical protein [Candidatus Micrarchaeota archaeon]